MKCPNCGSDKIWNKAPTINYDFIDFLCENCLHKWFIDLVEPSSKDVRKVTL